MTQKSHAQQIRRWEARLEARRREAARIREARRAAEYARRRAEFRALGITC